MEDTLQKLILALETADEEQTAALWQEHLGKAGSLKLALKKLAGLDAESRRLQGPIIQAAITQAEQLIKNKQAGFAASREANLLQEQSENLSISRTKLGHLHPVTITIRQMNHVFETLGYSVMEERELETDEFCFQRLNVPADHPARDMQDTIYIEEPHLLLRTQTSSIEARTLANFKPPFKVVTPGRTYRNEKMSKSNHFIFHQYQGVVVLEKVTMSDLLGTFKYLFQHIYGSEVALRFRSKYYPEVEPGVGVDIQCFSCQGAGCPLCKGVGWIEMGGAGMIHPKVLAMGNIDRRVFSGFAFGLGLDRLVMAKYHLGDIRTLLGGNLAYKPYYHENTL